MELQELIDFLTFDNNVHICIHDVSGLLSHPHFNILYKNKIHSEEICNCAKSTERGMNLCLTCKIMANNKAIREKELFIGHCPLGITEVVQPVVINGVVIAIIYIGNIIEDNHLFNQCVKRTSKITGVSVSKLLCCEDSLCKLNNKEYFIKMSNLINCYIKLQYNSFKVTINPNAHWAVEAFKNYALEYYNKNISLSQLSKLYHLNEIYMGRIFKQKTGMSFSNYLNKMRIGEACVMLERTDSPIINIALGTGFNNISYFSRVFKGIMNQTPSEYRNESYSKRNSEKSTL